MAARLHWFVHRVRDARHTAICVLGVLGVGRRHVCLWGVFEFPVPMLESLSAAHECA